MKNKLTKIILAILLVLISGVYWLVTGDNSIFTGGNEPTIEENDYFSRIDKVTLKECVDGDTARFIRDGKEIKVRFVGINAPEYTSSIEKWGKESSERCAELLKNAKKIELEYDENAGELDNHDRVLAWVWVDNQLLQAILVQEGWASNKYLKKNYKYYDELIELEIEAKKNKVGQWQE